MSGFRAINTSGCNFRAENAADIVFRPDALGTHLRSLLFERRLKIYRRKFLA